jgi:hypothetical protein
MANKQTETRTSHRINAQPRLHQRAREIQPYGTVNRRPNWRATASHKSSPTDRSW